MRPLNEATGFISCNAAIKTLLLLGLALYALGAPFLAAAEAWANGTGGLPQRLYSGVAAAVEARKAWSDDLGAHTRAFLDSPRAVSQTEWPRKLYGEHDPSLARTHLRFDMLGPVGPTCREGLGRWGDADDEKRACGLEQATAPCTVISVGSNNQWGFEVAVAERTPCRVETFDCTVGTEAQPPAAWRHRVRLHRICIGDRSTTSDASSPSSAHRSGGDHSRAPSAAASKFLDWEDALRHLGLSAPPVFLKMDIEGFEYGVLEAMVRSRRELLPLQIAVELHYHTAFKLLPWYGRFISAAEIAMFMDTLWRKGGYLLADRNDNRRCDHCSELLLVRPQGRALAARGSRAEV